MGSYITEKTKQLKKQNQNTTQTGIVFAKLPRGTRQTDFDSTNAGSINDLFNEKKTDCILRAKRERKA